jgi:hypothetical protein
VALGGLSLAGYLGGLSLVVGRGPATHQRYALLHLGLHATYLTAVALVLRRPFRERGTVALVLGLGLLFRLAVLPTPIFLSSDPYRYLWDGRVQRAGINPYRYPPAHPALAPLRDTDVHAHINRPAERTVYPPGAQAVFRLAATVAPDSFAAWRGLVLAADALTVALLLGLLRRLGHPPSAVLVYAWAPLVVFEGAQAGHVDLVMLPLLLGALALRLREATGRAGLLLAGAALVKPYAAVLLLPWLRRRDWRLPTAFAGAVALAYAVYTPGVGGGVLGFLPRYFGSAEDFNIGLRAFATDVLGVALGPRGHRGLGAAAWRALDGAGVAPVSLEGAVSPGQAAELRRRLGMPAAPLQAVIETQLGHELVRAAAMLALFAALTAALAWIAWRRTPGPEGLARAGRDSVAAYLLLVPTALHAWYAVWLVPFLALRPSPAWLWFTGAVSLSYLTYAWEALPLWVRLVEFVPLYALLAWEHRRGPASPPGPGAR